MGRASIRRITEYLTEYMLRQPGLVPDRIQALYQRSIQIKEKPMEVRAKEVRFDIYCKTCKYADNKESEDPCWDCLDQGWNEDSHKPIKWEAKE